MLNEYNEKTKGVIHLLVTSLCLRNCPYCCNKQYDLNDIPYVTEDELRNCHTLCLTGGEPFLFTDPRIIAKYYKNKYSNIKKIYVYTNATELAGFLYRNKDLNYIDGVSVSIKDCMDKVCFDDIVLYKSIQELSSNRLYVFNNLMPKHIKNFEVFQREWQSDFKPADDSIFRRV